MNGNIELKTKSKTIELKVKLFQDYEIIKVL